MRWNEICEDTSEVTAFCKEIEQRLGLQSFDVWMSRGDIYVNLLIVPRDKQKDGLGTKAMEELCRFADQRGLRITLSPGSQDDHHGTTSRSRLVKFYKRFGFVENKGRYQDFSISAGMVRKPRGSK